jgi:hypothetical protein
MWDVNEGRSLTAHRVSDAVTIARRCVLDRRRVHDAPIIGPRTKRGVGPGQHYQRIVVYPSGLRARRGEPSVVMRTKCSSRMPSVAEPVVETLLYLFDQAFDGGEHSLMANVRSLRDEDWFALVPGASRSAYDLLWHVASCKWMYDHYAFREGVWTWAEMESSPYENGPPYGRPGIAAGSASNVIGLLDWLQRAQARLRSDIAILDDGALLVERPSNWGKSYETRWLIKVMIEHDGYHAGEINHLRSLLEAEDRWAHEI